MRAGTLLRTVRHLRPEQLRGQLRRALGGRVRPRRARGPAPQLAVPAPAAPFLPVADHVRACHARRLSLVDRAVDFPDGIDWRFAGEGPLWAYHLHQMEWLRSPGITPAERAALVLDWIARNPDGLGWDGGPTSLRILHWLKLLATPGALPADDGTREPMLDSLADQIATLDDHPEVHLLGNHYLWNRIAVVAGGFALAGSESGVWRDRAGALRAELGRQVLADGAHEERAPMYHALLLESLLDLRNLLRATPAPKPPGLEEALDGAIASMLGALRVYTHPDGEIALFADSAFGIAARPADLEAYAAALGIAPAGPERPGVLDAGGYVRLEAGPFSLLASVAGPSPRHQPGHAHCDALAFELVVAGRRVVTDTGVYEYAAGPRRDASRATRSHATVEVDGRDQAELWAPHRIGGRPRVALVEVVPSRSAEATCTSWSTPRVVHRRRFEVGDAEVAIHDSVEGPPSDLRFALPLGPEVGCILEGHEARLELGDGTRLRVTVPEAARFRVESAPYFPRFGVEEWRPVLVGEARGPGTFAWRISR